MVGLGVALLRGLELIIKHTAGAPPMSLPSFS
jgi:hypothetical protein